MDEADIPDDVKVCNCADCGCLLVAGGYITWIIDRIRSQLPTPEMAFHRVNGRPYCNGCMSVVRPPPCAASKDECSPWGENAVRALEDAPRDME